jgi:hypothetical protein
MPVAVATGSSSSKRASGRDVPNTLLDTVCYLSSFGWMSSHPEKFDEHFIRATFDPMMGIASDVQNKSLVKLRSGQTKKSSSVWTPDCDVTFDAEFARVYASVDNVNCYDDLDVEDSY